MKVTRNIVVGAALTWLALPAQAQFIGLDLGPEHWPDGPARFAAGDFDDGRIDSEQPAPTLVLEHAITALPNIRFRGYSLDSNAAAGRGADIRFNGEPLALDDATRSSFELSHDDLVLYYQLSGNGVDLDLGVDLKRFDGQVSLNGDASTTVDVDETIPLFYLSARYALNDSGLYVGADINASFIDLGLSESDARDSTFMLGYDTGNGIGVEGGIKYYSLELDNADDLSTGLEYDGIYLNGYFNF